MPLIQGIQSCFELSIQQPFDPRLKVETLDERNQVANLLSCTLDNNLEAASTGIARRVLRTTLNRRGSDGEDASRGWCTGDGDLIRSIVGISSRHGVVHRRALATGRIHDNDTRQV